MGMYNKRMKKCVKISPTKLMGRQQMMNNPIKQPFELLLVTDDAFM